MWSIHSLSFATQHGVLDRRDGRGVFDSDGNDDNIHLQTTYESARSKAHTSEHTTHPRHAQIDLVITGFTTLTWWIGKWHWRVEVN